MILLTGGSGFIGSHFYNQLDPSQTVNFDLLKPGYPHDGIFVMGDIRERADVRKVFDRYSITSILSLAAKHHDFGIGHDEYFDTNEEGTRILCEEASLKNVRQIIFYSSVAVYGQRKGASSEDVAPEPDSSYGKSKLAGEEVIRTWVAEDPQRSAVIVRPTLVFGANNYANMYNLIRQIDSGWYFHLGSANNIKSIAYVENLVRATLFLLRNMKPGCAIYNYSDEPHLTSRQIADCIAGHLDKKIRLTVPKEVGKIFGYPFDAAIKLTGKNLPISSARIEKLATETFHEAKKIRNEGFCPEFSSVEGIGKMVSWYRNEKTKDPDPGRRP